MNTGSRCEICGKPDYIDSNVVYGINGPHRFVTGHDFTPPSRDYSKPLGLEIVETAHQVPLTLHYKGPDIQLKDEERLKGQYERIFDLMKDQRWRTLAEISAITHDPEGSIIRQLNYMGDPRFGGHTKKKERFTPGRGLWHYRIIPKGEKSVEHTGDPFHKWVRKEARSANF